MPPEPPSHPPIRPDLVTGYLLPGTPTTPIIIGIPPPHLPHPTFPPGQTDGQDVSQLPSYSSNILLPNSHSSGLKHDSEFSQVRLLLVVVNDVIIVNAFFYHSQTLFGGWWLKKSHYYHSHSQTFLIGDRWVGGA